jgi:hypothetical protein
MMLASNSYHESLQNGSKSILDKMRRVFGFMEDSHVWSDRFKKLFINNRFVLCLLILLLVGLNIFVFDKISFVFKPLTVLLKTVIFPILLTGALYYLLNPLVNLLERKRIPRIYTIVALYLAIIGIITLVIMTVIPLAQQQIHQLIDNFPIYSQEVQFQFESLIGSDFFNQIQQSTGFNPSDLGQTFSIVHYRDLADFLARLKILSLP